MDERASKIELVSFYPSQTSARPEAGNVLHRLDSSAKLDDFLQDVETADGGKEDRHALEHGGRHSAFVLRDVLANSARKGSTAKGHPGRDRMREGYQIRVQDVALSPSHESERPDVPYSETEQSPRGDHTRSWTGICIDCLIELFSSRTLCAGRRCVGSPARAQS